MAKKETMTMVSSSMAMRLAAYFMVIIPFPGERQSRRLSYYSAHRTVDRSST